MRDKGTYKIMRPFFSNTPEYVFRELFYANGGFFKTEFEDLIDADETDDEIEDVFMEWIDLKWKKKVLSFNIDDFTKSTQKSMAARGMGSVHLKNVPDDKERTLVQKDLAAKMTCGKNEPVIMLKTNKGYDLIEGWHRTMSILSLGSDGSSDYSKWDKVKINVWVGYGSYTDELSETFGTF